MHQRQVRLGLTFLLYGTNNRCIVLLLAIHGLWRNCILHSMEHRRLFHLLPCRSHSLLCHGLALGVKPHRCFRDSGYVGNGSPVSGAVVVLIGTGVAEDLIGNKVELIMDRPHHALDSFFNGLDARLELIGALLGVSVDGVEPHEELLVVLPCSFHPAKKRRKESN